MKKKDRIREIILIIVTLSSLSYAFFPLVFKKHPEIMPRYLAMNNNISEKDYDIVHESNDVKILFSPVYHSYAVVYQKDKLMTTFSDYSRFVNIHDPEGNMVALPVSNKLHKNMRFIYNTKDPANQLIDYDSDGFPDLIIENTRDKYYIYRHGYFDEITEESYQKKEKVLLNGDIFYFENGKWHKKPNKKSEN